MLMMAAQNVDMVAQASYQAPGASSVRGAARYKKLNLMSFWQHGTVEFRHHQGTVEAQKAENWVRMCLRMCLAAREGAKEFNSLDSFMTEMKASDGEKQFFAGRVAYFAGRPAETVARPARRRRY